VAPEFAIILVRAKSFPREVKEDLKGDLVDTDWSHNRSGPCSP